MTSRSSVCVGDTRRFVLPNILALLFGSVLTLLCCTATAETGTRFPNGEVLLQLPHLSTPGKDSLIRNVEWRCLATAVYFEARSETRLGQLAVATVILNRARTTNYPSSICGVVYQGAHRRNACQFSFACDGRSDIPQKGRAWNTALTVAAQALANERELRIVPTATHFHTEGVDPSWSRSLRRVTKIGRHIFYSQGL